MGLIQLRRPWTEQPLVLSGIDWGNPLARGLEFAINAGAGKTPHDLARGRPITWDSNITVEAGKNTPGSSGSITLISRPHLSFKIPTLSAGLTFPAWESTGEASLLILQKPPGSNNEWLSLSATTGTADHYTYGGLIYSDIFWSSRWVSGAAMPSGYFLDDPVAVGASVRANSQILTIDGVVKTSATNASSYSHPTTPRIGSHGGTTGFNGSVFAAFVWSRALQLEELAELSRNPWQLFQPRTIPIPLAAAAGGGPPTLTGITLSNITTSGYRATVTA